MRSHACKRRKATNQKHSSAFELLYFLCFFLAGLMHDCATLAQSYCRSAAEVQVHLYEIRCFETQRRSSRLGLCISCARFQVQLLLFLFSSRKIVGKNSTCENKRLKHVCLYIRLR